MFWVLGFLFSRPGTDGLMVWLMGWALSWEVGISGYVPAIGRVTGELAELGLFREMRLARHVYSVMVLQSVVCFLVVVVGLLACCFFRGLRGAYLWEVGNVKGHFGQMLLILLAAFAMVAAIFYLHYIDGYLLSDIPDRYGRYNRKLTKQMLAFGFTPYAGVLLFLSNAFANGCVLVMVKLVFFTVVSYCFLAEEADE